LVDQNLGDQTLVDQKAPTAATIKHRATVEDFHLVLSDGRTFPLGPFIGSTLGIGRAPDNQVIVNDVQVSGHHLKILVEGESLQIWDNHSTNGSLFNEQKLSSEQTTPLIMGDVVQIGAVKLWIAPLSAR
jgi:pSer/pThr/pTyr-binding forkhead associated (FHA) protein